MSSQVAKRRSSTGKPEPTAHPRPAVNLEHLGLCANCAHHATCMHDRRTDRLPILSCEDYGAEEEPTPVTWLPRPAPTPTPTPSVAVKGLCVNCEHRDTCKVQARGEGGVWHCELYE